MVNKNIVLNFKPEFFNVLSLDKKFNLIQTFCNAFCKERNISDTLVVFSSRLVNNSCAGYNKISDKIIFDIADIHNSYKVFSILIHEIRHKEQAEKHIFKNTPNIHTLKYYYLDIIERDAYLFQYNQAKKYSKVFKDEEFDNICLNILANYFLSYSYCLCNFGLVKDVSECYFDFFVDKKKRIKKDYPADFIKCYSVFNNDRKAVDVYNKFVFPAIKKLNNIHNILNDKNSFFKNLSSKNDVLFHINNKYSFNICEISYQVKERIFNAKCIIGDDDVDLKCFIYIKNNSCIYFYEMFNLTNITQEHFYLTFELINRIIDEYQLKVGEKIKNVVCLDSVIASSPYTFVNISEIGIDKNKFNNFSNSDLVLPNFYK